jgi:shikimate dehydrogenase
MIEQAIARHDLDWRFLTFEVDPENLGDAVRGLRALGFRGAQCAEPHKKAVLPLLDRMTDTAAMVGAINLVVREQNTLVGENTEGRGVVQAVRNVFDLAGKRVTLLGAGQFARATAVELASAGVAGVTIVNRTESRAAELVSLLSEKFSIAAEAVAWQDDYAVPPETDVLIHATSLAGGDDNVPLPLAAETLRPDLFVVDATPYVPRTWLLDEARKRGCSTLDGLTVCIEQVAISLQCWMDIDADRQVLREAAEEFLGV